MDEPDFLDDLVNRDMVGFFLYELHEIGTAIEEHWDFWASDDFEITVTRNYAERIYACCKEIMLIKHNGLNAKQMRIIRKARLDSHQFLYDEANDPATPIERKIQLVKLTSK